jgi:hypothetical protein
LQTCGVCRLESSDIVKVCPRCGADLRTKSLVRMALERLRANDRVSLIRISIAQDCCPACAEVQGAYPKDTVPTIPVEGCSHAKGCRCFYEPVLTEVYP